MREYQFLDEGNDRGNESANFIKLNCQTIRVLDIDPEGLIFDTEEEGDSQIDSRMDHIASIVRTN